MKALQDLEKYLSKTNIAGKHILLGTMFDFINHSINCQLVPNQDQDRWMVLLQKHGERLLKGLPKEATLFSITKNHPVLPCFKGVFFRESKSSRAWAWANIILLLAGWAGRVEKPAHSQ